MLPIFQPLFHKTLSFHSPSSMRFPSFSFFFLLPHRLSSSSSRFSSSLSIMSPSLEKSRQGNGDCRDGDSKSRVTIVGSGNWGSVAAKLIASNALKLPSFHDEVKMWVFEEVLPNGEKLTDVINKTNRFRTVALATEEEEEEDGCYRDESGERVYKEAP